MQTEATRGGGRKLWLTRDEYTEAVRAVDVWEKEIAVRLMGDCGLRVSEVVCVTYNDINRTSDGEHYLLTVSGAKDTTGELNEGKERQTWMPVELERDIYRFVTERGRDSSEEVVSAAKRTVQHWVDELGDDLAETTGVEAWSSLSCHDFRRHWAHWHGDERGTNPRVLMSLGGWDSWEGMAVYLSQPSEETIVNEMTE